MRTSVYLSIFFSKFFSACFRSLCGVRRTGPGQWPCLEFSPSQGHRPTATSRLGLKRSPLGASRTTAQECGALYPQPHPHHELLFLPVMDLCLLLPLLLQSGCHRLVLPADLMGQAPQVGKLGRGGNEVVQK